VTIEPIVLSGQAIRLEPLNETHHGGLCEAGLDEELWRLIPYRVSSAEEMSRYIQSAQAASKAGTVLAFATVDIASARVIGSTRFMNIDPANRRVEIGSTWIAKPWQRSVVNTEAKYLMLRHAFETWGCLRVELKTDALNLRSRAAILRIGAKQEGILRRHIITWSGRVRDTVYFSVLDSEWPEVQAELRRKLGRRD
jgi:RimJ/RimL family protein N-acetyltransferase